MTFHAKNVKKVTLSESGKGVNMVNMINIKGVLLCKICMIRRAV